MKSKLSTTFQAQHSRIFDAIEYVVYTYAQKTEQGLDTVLQAHIHKLERYLRVFQGLWRDKSRQYFSVTLRHIPAIVQYLLDNSYFTVGSQVFRQCRGASMGSQFAPVLCSAVALQREWNYHLSFSPFTWDRSLHHRYVDNRILLISQHSQCQTHVRAFWNLQFYSSPILLEVVEGQEALGFNVDAGQQCVTLLLPWVKPLRSMRSASTSRAPLSGLFARLRLIRSCVFPRELQIAQAQDLLGLMYSRLPDLFTTKNSQDLKSFLRRLFQCRSVDHLMQWCR